MCKHFEVADDNLAAALRSHQNTRGRVSRTQTVRGVRLLHARRAWSRVKPTRNRHSDLHGRRPFAPSGRCNTSSCNHQNPWSDMRPLRSRQGMRSMIVRNPKSRIRRCCERRDTTVRCFRSDNTCPRGTRTHLRFCALSVRSQSAVAETPDPLHMYWHLPETHRRSETPRSVSDVGAHRAPHVPQLSGSESVFPQDPLELDDELLNSVTPELPLEEVVDPSPRRGLQPQK
jgi:hypothetical protein